jgi:hypothetical protein
MALAIAGVVAANPVVITQLLNSYHDGVLASLLTICAAALVLWVRVESRSGLVMAAAAAVGAAAVKLTGPAYGAVLVAAAVAWQVQRGRWRSQQRAFWVAIPLAAAAVMLVSGGVYLTNAVRHGHPLYPVLGPDRVAIVGAPPHSRLQAMAASICSRSQAFSSDRESIAMLREWRGLKLPFRVDRDEVGAFLSPWVRVGGWGPWFSGVVALALALIGVTVVRRPGMAMSACLIVAPVIVSVLVNPYCWKARYAPQLWLAPLVIAAVILARSSARFERGLATALVVAAGVNSLLVGWGHGPPAIHASRELESHLLELGRRQETLVVDFRPFRANRVRLAELGIDFTEVEDRRYSLAVYNGYAPARLTRFEIDRGPDGGRTADLEWQPTAGAESYVVDVILAAPTASGGHAPSPGRVRTQSSSTTVTLPSGKATVTLQICNRLGCCPPKVLRVVDALE